MGLQHSPLQSETMDDQNSPGVNCGKCNNRISMSKVRAKCAICNQEYHLNKDCAGILPTSWTTKSEENRLNWRCLSCRAPRSNSTERGSLEEGTKKRRLSQSGTNEENSSHYLLVSELSRLLDAKFEVLRKNVHDLIDEHIRDKLDGIKKIVEDQRVEIATLRDENKQLCDRVVEMEKKCFNMESIKTRLDEQSQYTRRNNIIVDGVPEVSREEPIATVQRIAKAMNFNIEAKDIDACHRLPRKNATTEEPRPFLIKFVSRIVKTNFLIYCKKERFKASIFGGPPNRNIYVNEHLIKVTVDLLKKARELKKYKYRVETRDCVVFVKRDGEKDRVKILNHKQIEELIAQQEQK